MRVLDTKQFIYKPLDGSLQPSGQDRPIGLHGGDILHAMKEAAGESMDELPGEQPGIAMQAGFLWEIALEWAFKQFMGAQDRSKVEKQLHLELDGIKLTPDGFNRETWELEEYKTTARSMAKWEEDFASFWLWMVQVQMYLLALSKKEGKPVNVVRFFILFWYGDYSRKPGRGRQMVETAIEFTTEELEKNWLSVLRYKLWIEEKRRASAGGN